MEGSRTNTVYFLVLTRIRKALGLEYSITSCFVSPSSWTQTKNTLCSQHYSDCPPSEGRAEHQAGWHTCACREEAVPPVDGRTLDVLLSTFFCCRAMLYLQAALRYSLSWKSASAWYTRSWYFCDGEKSSLQGQHERCKSRWLTTGNTAGIPRSRCSYNGSKNEYFTSQIPY